METMIRHPATQRTMQAPLPVLLLCASLLSLPLLCVATVTTDQHTLQTVFSDALAGQGTSLGALSAQFGSQTQASTVANATLGYKESCLTPGQNFSALVACLTTEVKCLTIDQLEQLYSIPSTQGLTTQEVAAVSPGLIFSLLACNTSRDATMMAYNPDTHSVDTLVERPKSGATWGYSFLLVTVINLCSLTGALVLPCMKLQSYKIILMFMVGIAVGTLVGSGLLFLIPEAFGLVHEGDTMYIWKSSTIMGGVYLFYLIEKLLRFINSYRENTQSKKRQDEVATKDICVPSFRRTPIDNGLPGHLGRDCPEGDLPNICVGDEVSTSNSEASLHDGMAGEGDVGVTFAGSGTQQQLLNNINGKGESNGHSHTHTSMMDHQPGEVAPVAYMIIFGDALHNFIDGLSIGSAFTVSTMTGVSVSIACLCEELPHELGDFAILLNSGMPFKKAILYNFLSACTCYLGCAIGILLGENTASAEWIFAVAGGMFLYISLVDMMPEMNSAADSEEGKRFGQGKTFLVQNLGLLLGYSVMLIMALYGGEINFDG